MKHWRLFGEVLSWLLFPAFWVYLRCTPARTRVLVVVDDELLLVKNWLGSKNWSLPGGGKHRHEAAASAAARELQEEVGITVSPEILQPLGRFEVIEKWTLKNKIELFVLRLERKPNLVLQPREIMDATWMKLADVQRDERQSNTVKLSVSVWLND